MQTHLTIEDIRKNGSWPEKIAALLVDKSTPTTISTKKHVPVTCSKCGIARSVTMANLLKAKHPEYCHRCAISCVDQAQAAATRAVTNMTKYGAACSLQSAIVRAKAEATSVARYGAANAGSAQVNVAKSKQTNMVRYGVEHPSQSAEIREKTRQTNLARHGVEHTLALPRIRAAANCPETNAKRKKTMLARHGFTAPFASPAVRQTLNKQHAESTAKTLQTLLEANPDYSLVTDCGQVEHVWRRAEGNKELLKYQFRHDSCGAIFAHSLLSAPYCPACGQRGKASGFELKFADWLASEGVRVFRQHRDSAMRMPGSNLPFEIDVFLPDQKIGFEFNGFFYHHGGVKDRLYHAKKSEECLRAGVKLYHVWEDAPIAHVRRVVAGLLPKSKNNTLFVGGRNTVVRKINTTGGQLRNFEEEHHRAGRATCSLAYGLFVADDLVSAITFRKTTTPGLIENARYTCRHDRVVHGGFSKLMRAAVPDLKALGCSTILTYCDRDWSPDPEQTIYRRHGFKLIGDTGPMLRYWASKNITNASGAKVIPSGLYPRQKFQKHKLAGLLDGNYCAGRVVNTAANKPANQTLAELGIFPLYNSGNWRYELAI